MPDIQRSVDCLIDLMNQAEKMRNSQIANQKNSEEFQSFKNQINGNNQSIERYKMTLSPVKLFNKRNLLKK